MKNKTQPLIFLLNRADDWQSPPLMYPDETHSLNQETLGDLKGSLSDSYPSS